MARCDPEQHRHMQAGGHSQPNTKTGLLLPVVLVYASPCQACPGEWGVSMSAPNGALLHAHGVPTPAYHALVIVLPPSNGMQRELAAVDLPGDPCTQRRRGQ
ncbi:hypothetical protein O1611_g10394 [Lasiodiplodia mahajangana]|uniref:Uncharacterized protein n=1 Tax=Lasiodiplodia mahajangana TaxID=1108764 RepID=A0ACC2IZG2_9PEZI|nr:hypothetical protein O1611_g10394 [Lasiodiplodia mahajangana]